MNELAELLRRITLGVYVIGVADAQRRSAFTAAWVMQTSYRPPLLALAVNPHNASHPILKAGGGFVVNVLERGQLDLARHFGGASAAGRDKLDGIAWRPGHKGIPVLDQALAFFECDLEGCLPAGDHEIVLGRVVHAAFNDPAAEPMGYAETGGMDGSSALYRSD